jgi:hypothetical protein
MHAIAPALPSGLVVGGTWIEHVTLRCQRFEIVLPSNYFKRLAVRVTPDRSMYIARSNRGFPPLFRPIRSYAMGDGP